MKKYTLIILVSVLIELIGAAPSLANVLDPTLPIGLQCGPICPPGMAQAQYSYRAQQNFLFQMTGNRNVFFPVLSPALGQMPYGPSTAIWDGPAWYNKPAMPAFGNYFQSIPYFSAAPAY